MTCEACGKEMRVGDWPFCPHERMTHFGEKPMEPHVDDMIDRNGPVEFRTWGEKVRYMDKNAIVPKDVDHHRPERRLYFT